MKERIQKVLAAAGVASRRAIEEMVVQGRVMVNGRTMVDLPVMIDPRKDKVTIDGERVELGDPGQTQLWYLMMHKPRGYVCSTTAQGVQKRVLDLLPPEFAARVYPVGRFDLDSTGLLLLTNDGELTQQLTHPKFGVTKTYRVTVNGKLAGEAMTQLETGVFLVDRHTGTAYKTQKCVIKVVDRSTYRTVVDVTLKEGRNRQIWRMFAKVGFEVKDLVRTHFGPLKLDRLPLGSVRPLTEDELKAVRNWVDPEKVAKRQQKFEADRQEARKKKMEAAAAKAAGGVMGKVVGKAGPKAPVKRPAVKPVLKTLAVKSPVVRKKAATGRARRELPEG
jgi:23S rRNA pseudouridine2605 synthase